MMATAAPMSHSQQPNRKLGSLAQDCFTDGIVDHEMHLKMSKKIAQLTKVIYALNTKNDEHEQIMKAVQQQHEKEREQLMAETKQKLERFQNRLGVETDLRKKIGSLEHNVEEYEKQKKTLLHNIQRMKDDWKDKEAALQTQYQQQVSSLNKTLEQCQTDFNSRVNKFESLLTEFEQEKKDAILDLKKCHQLEVENLLKAQRNESTGLSGELAELERRYTEEMAALRASCDSLKTAAQQQQEDYEEKLKKLKALYEKEIELLQSNQSRSFSEKEALLQEKLDRLSKDLQFQEVQSRKRVDGLLEEAAQAESRVADLQSQISQLHEEQNKHKQRIASISDQLRSTEEERDSYMKQCQDLKEENRGYRGKVEALTSQLSEQSQTMNSLIQIKGENESKIQALLYELADIKRSLKLVEEERDSLLSKSSSDSKQKSREVRALEEALEDLRIEKRAQKDKYDMDVSALEKRLKEAEERAQCELREQSERLGSEHEKAITALQEHLGDKIATTQQEWKLRLEKELANLEADHKGREVELNSKVEDLTRQLDCAHKQLKELTAQVGDKASNLGAATQEVNSLREEVTLLRKRLEVSAAELKEASQRVKDSEAELESVKEARRQLVEEHGRELSRQLEELRQSTEQAWAARLEQELARLRSELSRNYENERAMTMEELASRNEREMSEMKKSYKDRISSLSAKVSELERLLNQQRQDTEQRLSEATNKYVKMNEELMEKLEAAAKDYERKQEEMKAAADAQLLEALEAKSTELEVLLAEAKSRHMEEMSAQMTAHKLAIDMANRESETRRSSELHELRAQLEREKEVAECRLMEKHKKEMESSNSSFMKQTTALRMELQRAAEISRQKDGELTNMKEEFTERLENREQSIKNLQKERTHLDQAIAKLNKEIEAKGQELLQARSEANSRIRAIEKELAAEHLDEMESLKLRQHDEMQQILAEFTKAQTILKEKIEELSLMLEEAEERYRNREPREQDLDMIAQLRHALVEREQQMQQLLAEKQFYQMELVNRETNFTKVFAGTEASNKLPQVGFINPLAKKKKGDKGQTKYTTSRPAANGSGSAGSAGSQQRLRPIAGSPIHDEKLNPNSVLPPPQALAKKFVQ